MDNEVSISTQIDAMRDLFEKHLGVRAPTLEKAVRRAGRRLPRGVRAKAGVLVEAEGYATHPKLERRIDRAATDAAVNELSTYLKAQDLDRERTTRRLNALAGLVFNLLLVGALLIVVLRWRGFI